MSELKMKEFRDSEEGEYVGDYVSGMYDLLIDGVKKVFGKHGHILITIEEDEDV